MIHLGLLLVSSLLLAAEARHSRIVGGYVTDIKEIPYQVSVQQYSLGGHVCGGSIISDRWILTAAHCKTVNDTEDDFYVRVGSTSQFEGGVIHNVSSIILHEDFSPKTFKNDIALMHLSDPITVNSHAGITDLVNEDFEIEEGSVVQVSGWGATRNINETRENLRFVEVLVQNQKKCARSYKKQRLDVTDKQFCAGSAAGGKDACTGDSGGPITYEGVQVGVVSYGRGCARAKYPGIYTKVSKYREWIRLHSGV